MWPFTRKPKPEPLDIEAIRRRRPLEAAALDRGSRSWFNDRPSSKFSRDEAGKAQWTAPDYVPVVMAATAVDTSHTHVIMPHSSCDTGHHSISDGGSSSSCDAGGGSAGSC